MCTSIAMFQTNAVFGRNLDLEQHFSEAVVITPQNYPFHFQKTDSISSHFAMIGMASVVQDVPLYAEAMNEKGLYMAGLNFPHNACYAKAISANKTALAPYELIPWILSQCENVAQAEEKLSRLSLLDLPFTVQGPTPCSLPVAPLHWQIADSKRALVVEALEDGLHLYEDRIGVLTNNPPFPFHQMNLSQYQHLSPAQSCNRFAKTELPSPFAQGMGAIGLPGDYSSASRYVKAAFLKLNSVCEQEEEQQVMQFFHILDAVAMVKGSVITEDKQLDLTLYSCCISAGTKTYYYRTYENSTVHAIRMKQENMEGSRLSVYPLQRKTVIVMQN